MAKIKTWDGEKWVPVVLVAEAGTELIVNSDIISAINQRFFDGDWDSLYDGDYGYDRWLRVDGNDKGQIIPNGAYNYHRVHTLSYYVGTTRTVKQITSPWWGPWLVNVPHNADRISCREGEEVKDYVLENPIIKKLICYSFYTIVERAFQAITRNYRDYYIPKPIISFPVPMREVRPRIEFTNNESSMKLNVYNQSDVTFTVTNNMKSMDKNYYGRVWVGYIADCELYLTDVN